MNENLARQLYVHGELQHEPEYFGRGMSKPTHALIGSYGDLFESLSSLVGDLVVDALGCEDDEAKSQIKAQYEELHLDSLSDLRVDNIGSELIFY